MKDYILKFAVLGAIDHFRTLNKNLPEIETSVLQKTRENLVDMSLSRVPLKPIWRDDSGGSAQDNEESSSSRCLSLGRTGADG